MAFDACMMRAVIQDISARFTDGKVEKVLQPQNDEIDLVIHGGRVSRRIVFNVGPNAPRLQISDTAKENPLKAPMFCMLLRKHLTGGKLLRIEQPDFDRIAVFVFSTYDDMGFRTECRLICEIMGKYTNLIFTDADGKVISALKIVDFADSTVRQVLPGLPYVQPAGQGKASPLQIDRAFFMKSFAEFPSGRSVEKFITGTWGGIAVQVAHELCFRATGRIDVPMGEANADVLYDVFSAWQKLLVDGSYTPTVVYGEDGQPREYFYMPVSYLGEMRTQTFSELSGMFDTFFNEKDRREKIRQRAHDVLCLLTNAENRTEKKLAVQRETLAESEHAEDYRKKGDLITANIYRLKKGAQSLTTVDYSDENCPEVTVTLDTRLTPAQNAQKMYKLYNKAKNAVAVLTKCIGEWENELVYLDSVRDALLRASSEEDILQIRDELYRNGYASKMKGYTSPRQLKSRPMEFRTASGYRLLVGKNNTQNDELTFRTAQKGDLWFHVKDLPGSHVILVCGGEEPAEEDYTQAAAVAAFHSKATGDVVAVDYTRVKNVKKPQGAKPGFVIYKTNYTAFVKPMFSPDAEDKFEQK